MKSHNNIVQYILGKLEYFDFQVYCHICGEATEPDYICERCGETYCEGCSAPFTPTSQIDYNCCSDCVLQMEIEKAEYYNT